MIFHFSDAYNRYVMYDGTLRGVLWGVASASST